MKVVLDTNILVSAALISGGNEDRVLRSWQRGLFELVLSPQILEEMGRVLLSDRIRRRRWMADTEVTRLLQLLADEAFLVTGSLSIQASRDPHDDKFLAAAVEGRARYVVTGDKDLLDLTRYRNVQIITPAAFLELLQKEGEP